MKHFYKLSLLALLVLWSCQSHTELDPGSLELAKKKPTQVANSTTETFDSGSKGSYAEATVTLESGVWRLSDALLGSLSSDRFEGAKSVRMRNSGFMSTEFDFVNGASTLEIKHAVYGSDGSSTWEMTYSTNGGSSWIKTGNTITTSSTGLQSVTFTVNVSGNIRFRINKLSGGSNRINFDTFILNEYGGGGGTPGTEFTEEFEEGSKGSYSNGNVTLLSGPWYFSNALLGTSSSDRKLDGMSVRIRKTGTIQMNFDLTGGASAVTLEHALYGSDDSSDWQLEYSTNSGSSWNKIGSTITTSSTTLQTATFNMEINGNVRFKINKTSGGKNDRINIDRFQVTPYGGNSEDTTPPLISSVSSSAGATSASITWVTDEDASSQVEYGTTTSYGNSTTLNASLVMNHNEWITGLTESTTYHYRVKATDGSGNTAISGDFTFTTTSSGGGNPPTSVHLTFGNPSGAVTNEAYTTNYLMIKDGYALSYHEPSATPNWVSWHLDNSWIGSASRQNDYRADNSLPSGWNRADGGTFGSPYDRGHLTPSADRTSSVSINSETFLMTNFLPQASNNNQGPWNYMEQYLRGLFPNELYVIAGGHGSDGRTTQGGDVNIPNVTWKVILIIPSGENDVSRVTTSTRTIAVILPNNNNDVARSDDWKTFRVSIDQVEALTGYDFFSELPDHIENVIEAVVDNQ